MNQTIVERDNTHLQQAIDSLEVALPVLGDTFTQDTEWIVVNTDSGWRKIRLHDYGEVYSTPGLYEKWVYELFKCRSPHEIADRLIPALSAAGVSPNELTVLDLGAGNGYVADVLHARGIEQFVGVDIYQEAAAAAERDRPGLYRDFVVGDMTALPPDQSAVLDGYKFNCMACVAALGFGDIPPEVFTAAYQRVELGGWIAFTINADFVSSEDCSGFAHLVQQMEDAGVMETVSRTDFVHRVATGGEKLVYEAYIGRKRGEISRA